MSDKKAKRLVLFGGTGGTGSHLLKFALEGGFRVRAYVRSPNKLPQELQKHPNLEIAQGDFDNGEAIQAAIEGADFVICAAGNAKLSKQRRVMPPVVEQIVAGMRKYGVKCFVYQAGAFSAEPGEKLSFFVGTFMRPVFGTLFGIKGMLKDNDMVIAYLHEHASDLDWTVTRPGLIQDGPSKGVVSLSQKAGGAVQFIDLAKFTLELATSNEQIRKFPYVNYQGS